MGEVLCLELGVPPAAESDLLLREAQGVWENVRAHYRDGCLRVGGLLQGYVVARLREADGLPEAARLARELIRERAVEDAADRLGMTTGRAHELVRVAAAVDTLSDGGDVGRLSYQALRAMAVLVQRARGSAAPSEGEAWSPKAVVGLEPTHFFRRCVRENWSAERVRGAIRRMPVARGRGRRPTARPPAPPEIVKTAREAHPLDLAEMILALIAANPAREEVVSLVRAGLAGGGA